MYGACISVLLQRGCRVALDEDARHKYPDVGKLKSASRFRRQRLQGAHSEAAQETPTVIGLPGPGYAVPVVGETPAVRADHQMTNVMRAADLRVGQRAKSPQIAPQHPRISKRMGGSHALRVRQALPRVKHARPTAEFCKTSRAMTANGDSR